MIKIIDGTELGYASGGPVISLTHKVGKQELADIIRLAHAQWGDCIFEMAGVELPTAERKGSYLCFVEGGAEPHHIHTTRRLAMAEADRLAHKTGRPSHVLQSVAKVTITTQTLES